MASREGAAKNDRCCIWSFIIVVLVVLGVGGFLVYWFGVRGNVNDSFEEVFGNTTLFPPVGPPTTNSPTPTPFEFNQCTNTEGCCNGVDGLCNLPVNQVLFATTHNSYASEEHGFRFFLQNHFLELERQVEAGYRGIQLDICNCNGNLILCHGTCTVPNAFRDLKTVLTFLRDFLLQNPTEVLYIQLELNNGADQRVDINALYQEMQSVDNFIDFLYHHANPSDPWPTLQDLKDSNQRIVLFHHGGNTCTDDEPCPLGLNFAWSHIGTTPFSFVSVNAVNDYDDACPIQRGDGGSMAWYEISHFTTLPNSRIAEALGSKETLNAKIQACSERNGNRAVTSIIVDYWTKNELLEVVQQLNTAKANAVGTTRRLRAV